MLFLLSTTTKARKHNVANQTATSLFSSFFSSSLRSRHFILIIYLKKNAPFCYVQSQTTTRFAPPPVGKRPLPDLHSFVLQHRPPTARQGARIHTRIHTYPSVSYIHHRFPALSDAVHYTRQYRAKPVGAIAYNLDYCRHPADYICWHHSVLAEGVSAITLFANITLFAKLLNCHSCQVGDSSSAIQSPTPSAWNTPRATALLDHLALTHAYHRP